MAKEIESGVGHLSAVTKWFPCERGRSSRGSWLLIYHPHHLIPNKRVRWDFRASLYCVPAYLFHLFLIFFIFYLFISCDLTHLYNCFLSEQLNKHHPMFRYLFISYKISYMSVLDIVVYSVYTILEHIRLMMNSTTTARLGWGSLSNLHN